MNLPVLPRVRPMLGRLASALPDGEWWFEPKWDGFRVVVFRDGEELALRSRADKPLLRFFPELRGPMLDALPERCVVDGEIVLARGGALDFDALQSRLHPAKSRIDMLAETLPSRVILWDCLACGDADLRPLAFRARRAELEGLLTVSERVALTPGTLDSALAADWFDRFEGAGLDGVMAKGLDDPYVENQRGFIKVKHLRTIDCVIMGFRWYKRGVGVEVGSLVLGLFDEQGTLRPIGVCSAFSADRRVALREELAPLREAAPDPVGPDAATAPASRWSAGRSLEWEPVRRERVVEVSTTQHSARRLRHPAKMIRFREDKPLEDCTLDQLSIVPAPMLSQLFTPPGPQQPG